MIQNLERKLVLINTMNSLANYLYGANSIYQRKDSRLEDQCKKYYRLVRGAKFIVSDGDFKTIVNLAEKVDSALDIKALIQSLG